MHPNAKLFALSAMAIWMAGAAAKAQEGQTINEGYPQSPDNTVQSGRPNVDVTGIDNEDIADDDDGEVVTGDGEGDAGFGDDETDDADDDATVAE